MTLRNRKPTVCMGEDERNKQLQNNNLRVDESDIKATIIASYLLNISVSR